MTELNGRLDSWKEIARHLGRDVRTVMRWERERGLPVYRLSGAKRSVVYAFREELDQWLARGSSQEAEAAGEKPALALSIADSPQPVVAPSARNARLTRPALMTGLAAVAFVVVAIVVASTLLSNLERRPVRTLVLDDRALVALDAQERTLWVHRFDAAGIYKPARRWTHIGDLDGDGSSEIVAVVKIQRTPASAIIDEMLCFSEDGQLRWTRVPDARLRFGDGEYGPPWASEDLLVFNSNGEQRLAWAVRHYTWWPSMVLVLDATGASRERFVNSGWIRSLAVAPGGRALMASGITNAHGAHFLALLDPRRIAGSSPETAHSTYACLDCGAERPLHYFVLPRTDASEHTVFPPQQPPVIQTLPDAAVQLRVSQNNERHEAEMLYEFSDTNALVRARATDQFWVWHRQLETAGLIQHDDRACSLRRSLDIHHWTPADGWQTLRVPAG